MSGETPEAKAPTTTTTVSGKKKAATIARIAGYKPLAASLEETEARLARAVTAQPRLLGDVAGHLLAAGGKRVRPALALLFADLVLPAQATPAQAQDIRTRAVSAGVSCELVHLGSLYHDDVIDEATTRRGVPTVNVNWSNTVAVLAGDFLLARASEISAQLGADVADMLAWTITQLVMGELLELEQLFDHTTSVETYFKVVDGKTASLMGTSCRLGSLMADPSSTTKSDLAFEFGSQLGRVFQIVDDILDLVADESATGKRTGIDLLEGVYTLPVLLAVHNEKEKKQKNTLAKLLENQVNDQVLDETTNLIRKLGGIEDAKLVAAHHLTRCEEILRKFPQNTANEALSRLARYVLSRAPEGTSS